MRFEPLFNRVKTDDPRLHIRQIGVSIERPGDPRGNSVNVLAIGGRLDCLTEFQAQRRAKADRAAVAERDGDHAVAQVVHDVPVTAIAVEAAPVVETASA